MVLYGVPILSILLVLPTSQVTSLSGFVDAMKTAGLGRPARRLRAHADRAAGRASPARRALLRRRHADPAAIFGADVTDRRMR
jgi:hypothetical protein